jgi:hypothetical protein
MWRENVTLSINNASLKNKYFLCGPHQRQVKIAFVLGCVDF